MDRSSGADPLRRRPVEAEGRPGVDRSGREVDVASVYRPRPRRRRLDEPLELERRFAPVLDGLTFPAQRWQILATAEYYGADGVTLHLLHSLRATRYATLTDVVADIARSAAVQDRLAGRPEPDTR